MEKGDLEAILETATIDHEFNAPSGDFDDSDAMTLSRALVRKRLKLESLNLTTTEVSDAGVQVLVRNRYMSQLKWLRLGGTQVRDAGVKAIAESRHISQLRLLNLWGTQVTDAGATAIASSDGLSKLNVLNLSETRVSDAGLIDVARSQYVRKLRSLHLGGTPTTDRGAQALAQSPCFSHLESLNLGATRVKNEGLQAIARSPYLKGLGSLNLADTEVGCDGIQALIESELMSELKSLNLSGTQVRNEELKALAASPNASKLESLKLVGTRVNDEGIQALAESPYLSDLKWLHLRGTQVALPARLSRVTKASALFDWVREIAKGQVLPEVKVPVLGMGQLGKSLLCRRLAPQNDEEQLYPYVPDHESTHAFDVRCLELSANRGQTRRDFLVRVFDFGGQPEMHGAHRFFLADQRNVYLVIVSSRLTAEENRLEYWLRMIHTVGGRSPTVVVVTHCDDEPSSDEKTYSQRARTRRLEPLDADALAQQYGFPLEIVDGYSNFTGKNLVDVREAIGRAVTRLDAAFDARYSIGFFRIKDWLEGEPPEELQGFPAFDRYLRVGDHFRLACEKCGQLTREGQERWLKLLGDLGVLHWVGDRPEVKRNVEHELEDLFFNPLWVKGPVYDVVCDTNSRENGGRSSQEKLDQLLGRQGVERAEDRRRLAALMLACELCFKIGGGRREAADYLIVDQVPSGGKGVEIAFPKPHGADEKTLDWNFDFLPDHLLAQLLGRWFRYHDPKGTYYRDEVVFDRDKCRLQIKAYPAKHRWQLTFQFKLVREWRSLHDLIEREVRSMFDPEDVDLDTSFWEVVDREEQVLETLERHGKRLMGELIDVLPQCLGISLNEGLRGKLMADLEAKIMFSLIEIPPKRRAQRLAYQACYVAFLGKQAAGEPLAKKFPLDEGMRVIKQVGTWVNDHPKIKDALLDADVDLIRELAKNQEESKSHDQAGDDEESESSKDNTERMRTLDPSGDREFRCCKRHTRRPARRWDWTEGVRQTRASSSERSPRSRPS